MAGQVRRSPRSFAMMLVPVPNRLVGKGPTAPPKLSDELRAKHPDPAMRCPSHLMRSGAAKYRRTKTARHACDPSIRGGDSMRSFPKTMPAGTG